MLNTQVIGDSEKLAEGQQVFTAGADRVGQAGALLLA